MNNEIYNEDYYEHGIEKGISGYENYSWLPNLTIPMCESIVTKLGISKDQTILDYGCAKGYMVKAFRQLGYEAYGVDTSHYAIRAGRAENIEHIWEMDINSFALNSQIPGIDWIICKDVLEHVDEKSLPQLVRDFAKNSKKIFIVVPLGENGKYVVPEYEGDVTHVVRRNLGWWKALFAENGYPDLQTTYSFKGVKENWSHYAEGNGFLYNV